MSMSFSEMSYLKKKKKKKEKKGGPRISQKLPRHNTYIHSC